MSPFAKPILIGRSRPAAPVDTRPDWQQADPAFIHAACRRAEALPSGGWYVVDASRAIGSRPRCVQVQGKTLVVWRGEGAFFAAPNDCPHMGASLAGGRVEHGKLVCPWHGLALGADGHERWRPLPSHDDGVLCWVQLAREGELPSDAPMLPRRPSGRVIDATIRVEADCEPRDVLQNRFDPWHGVHFHPHSFARLAVIEQHAAAITVRVAYRIFGNVAIEVDARFDCPDPRTIAMTIVEGDGKGSVVETHATPIAPGRTAIIETTLATSDRVGFAFAHLARSWLRPYIASRARRLWLDDAAYSERLYALRQRGERSEQPAQPRSAVHLRS